MTSSNQGQEQITPEQVLNEYAPRIYNLARRLVNNDADAEDVTQDVLLQVIRKLDTFRGESAFSTWLYRVTVNAALAYRRKRAHHEQGRVYEEMGELSDEHLARPGRRW